MIHPSPAVKFAGWFLKILYHRLAWGYDLVAAIVSAGQWNHWVSAILPMIEKEPILEIGFGPGHLQKSLHARFAKVYGADASRQMARIARARLRRSHLSVAIIQAQAQALPFPNDLFMTIVSTFPAPFIIQPATLAELRRVINPEGTVIILISALPEKTNPVFALISWLFQRTGQSSGNLDGLRSCFHAAGFATRRINETTNHARLLFIEAVPTSFSP